MRSMELTLWIQLIEPTSDLYLESKYIAICLHDLTRVLHSVSFPLGCESPC